MAILNTLVRKISRALDSNGLLLRFAILHSAGRLILPKYRFKWPQMNWWDDQQFSEYLKRFNEIAGMNADRRWMLYQLMRLVAAIPGDTAECGVYKGQSSYLICKINRINALQQRIHFAFDSYKGLSEPSALDGKHWTKGSLSCSIDEVKKNLGEFKNVSFQKGWIPERFSHVENRKFSFVHIDLDLHQPTRDSIQFFYPRMNNGGIILCDDYGFTTCLGVTTAIDEFLKNKPEKMISLSCGGGFLIKECKTTSLLKLTTY